MRGKVGLIFFIVLVSLLLFDQAFARGTLLDQNTIEYYTYGGFTAVAEAWRKIGLIFSDSKFVGLFFGVALLGAIILYFMVLAKTTIAGVAKFNLANWAIPVLLSGAIYMAFILPKKNIIVHDEVLNRDSEVISNIPSIVAITAGALNRIERELISIVKTSASSPVEDYTRNAGGTGFTILSQFGDPVTITMAAVPMYVHQTAYQFIKDCLLLELARSGTDLTAQDINLGKKSFIQAIEEARNPGVPTIYYDDKGKEIDTENGQEVNCHIAGGKLITYIQNYSDAVIKSSCALSGFNIDSPQEMNACMSLLESTYKNGLKQETRGGGNLNLLSAQAFFAQALINTLNSINPESSIKLMATKEAASQYLGLTIHANTWLPVIRETLRAVAIAITPFVLLFAATPLVGRALGFVLGMMVWVVTWSVIDAILHYAAVSQALAASEEFSNVITDGVPGSMFFVLLPSYTSKVAATFGAIRWAGLGLATVLTGMLIRFGGAALAMVAGSITGAAQSAGAAMGRMVADVTSPIRADLVPTASWTNAAVAAGGVSALAEGLIRLQAGGLAGQADAGNFLDFQTIRSGTAASTAKPLRRGAALGVQGAAEAGRIEGEREFGEVSKKLALENRYGQGLFATLGALGATREVEMGLGDIDVARAHRMSLEEYFRKKAHGTQINIDTYQEPYGPLMLRTPDGYIILQRPPGFFTVSSRVDDTRSLGTLYKIDQKASKEKSWKQETTVSTRRGWQTTDSRSDKERETRGRGHRNQNISVDETVWGREEFSGNRSHLGLGLELNPRLREPYPYTPYTPGTPAAPGTESIGAGEGPIVGPMGPGGKKPSRFTILPGGGIQGGGGIFSQEIYRYMEGGSARNVRETYRNYDWTNAYEKDFTYSDFWGRTTQQNTTEGEQFSISTNYGTEKTFQHKKSIDNTIAFNLDNLALKIYADTHPELSKLPERVRYAEAEKRLQKAFFEGDQEEIQRYYQSIEMAKQHLANVMPQPAQDVIQQGPEVQKEVNKEMEQIKKKVSPPKKPKRRNKK
jgi:hypothetical protein